MNSERLDNLFGEIRNEATETSVAEVGKWIAISAASAGLFGLLSQFKLPILLTKKLIIMTSVIATIGIGATAILLSSSAKPVEPVSETTETLASITLPENNSQQPEKRVFASMPTPIEDEKGSESNIDKIDFIPAIKLDCDNAPTEIVSTPIHDKKGNNKACEGIEREVGYFNKLKVGGAFEVFISQGESESVIIKTNDEEAASKVKTEVNNKVLEISHKGRKNGGMKIYITMSDIKEFSISGASQVQSLDLMNAPELELNVSGAAQLTLEIRSDALTLKSSGAAGIQLSGSASSVNIAANGAASVRAYDLKTKHTEIEASGAASVQTNASEVLVVKAKDASNVNYDGVPASLKIDNSLSANVSQRR